MSNPWEPFHTRNWAPPVESDNAVWERWFHAATPEQREEIAAADKARQELAAIGAAFVFGPQVWKYGERELDDDPICALAKLKKWLATRETT